MNDREEKIAAAVAEAGALIGELLKLGPVTPEQAGLLIAGNVRAMVPNAEEFEIIGAAKIIAADVAKARATSRLTLKNRKRSKNENHPNEV